MPVSAGGGLRARTLPSVETHLHSYIVVASPPAHYPRLLLGPITYATLRRRWLLLATIRWG
eukprot:5223598-Alexandrium_andersonii.AAC.1